MVTTPSLRPIARRRLLCICWGDVGNHSTFAARLLRCVRRLLCRRWVVIIGQVRDAHCLPWVVHAVCTLFTCTPWAAPEGAQTFVSMIKLADCQAMVMRRRFTTIECWRPWNLRKTHCLGTLVLAAPRTALQATH